MSTARVALTFEAGGDPATAARVLDTLHDAGAAATIFLDGRWSAEHPDLIRRMTAEGHELGNHAYTHPDLTLLGDEEIREELRRTDELAQHITGQRAHPWLRPPFGACNDHVREVAAAEGYRVVQRDAVDGGHWPGANTPERVLRRTLENAADGAVIAYHLSSPLTLAALPQIVEWVRAGGYALVHLSDLPAVSERAERHADLAAMEVEPGYLQALRRGARVWSINLPEFGGRAIHADGATVDVAATDGWAATLVTATEDVAWRPALHRDRYLLVVAGAVECLLRPQGEEQPCARAIGRPGDFILWAEGCEARLAAFHDRRRWIVMILG